jgi:hypothetical protein
MENAPANIGSALTISFRASVDYPPENSDQGFITRVFRQQYIASPRACVSDGKTKILQLLDTHIQIELIRY